MVELVGPPSSSLGEGGGAGFILYPIDRNPYGIIVDGARQPTVARRSRTPMLTTSFDAYNT
jgi:hypothetical protein